ncbi:hypothetical protein LY78DRAFT_661413 [Colletotrichum sublineola]|nr:hypothetical protein LY78DRAFT_661413 [Colletotrichum sublineola]
MPPPPFTYTHSHPPVRNLASMRMQIPPPRIKACPSVVDWHAEAASQQPPMPTFAQQGQAL